MTTYRFHGRTFYRWCTVYKEQIYPTLRFPDDPIVAYTVRDLRDYAREQSAKDKRRELHTLIHDRISEWFFATGGELPDGFPVSQGIQKARDLNDGSDTYCDYADTGIDDVISVMSLEELRSWAQWANRDTP